MQAILSTDIMPSQAPPPSNRSLPRRAHHLPFPPPPFSLSFPHLHFSPAVSWEGARMAETMISIPNDDPHRMDSLDLAPALPSSQNSQLAQHSIYGQDLDPNKSATQEFDPLDLDASQDLEQSKTRQELMSGWADERIPEERGVGEDEGVSDGFIRDDDGGDDATLWRSRLPWRKALICTVMGRGGEGNGLDTIQRSLSVSSSSFWQSAPP